MTPAWPHRRLAWAAMGAATLHIALLFALDQGLLRARPPEAVRLVDLTARVIVPVPVQPTPLPIEAPTPLPQTRPRVETMPLPVTPTPRRSDRAEPRPPLASPDLPSSPTVPAPVEATAAAPLAATAPAALGSPPNSASAPAPSAAPVATATPARQAAIELPNSQAGYLNNPLPLYPKASERLREQGRTVVRVTINASGVPQSADIVESSGFVRLDRAAQATAMAWRYVPGRRAGVPEAMAVDVPIVWRLPD